MSLQPRYNEARCSFKPSIKPITDSERSACQPSPATALMLGVREAGLAGAPHLGVLTLTSITLKVKCHALLHPDCSSSSQRLS